MKKINLMQDPALEGGGTYAAEQYIHALKTKGIGKVDTLMETFAGCGLIGFALLENDLCNNLVLIDINPVAIEWCNKTIKENGLTNVKAYVSDCFDTVPPMQVDLMVGNPPHYWTSSEKVYESDRRVYDPNMRIHKKFYQQAKDYLKPGGSILLWEAAKATHAEDFFEMIGDAGLEYVESYPSQPIKRFLRKTYGSKTYFIHSKRPVGT